MKTYKVACQDDDHGVEIVFANRAKDVDKFANSENCDCEFLERTVHREPLFDKYAPGPVTTRQFLAEGWHIPCGQCQNLLHEVDNPLVADDDRAYCNVSCVERSLEFWRKRGPNGVHESVREAAIAAEALLAKGPTQ